MTEIDPINAVGSLADPVRRALYEFVIAQSEPVGRELAARSVQIPAHKAKFHLDRLVSEGLLASDYRRLTGKTGPGAGRPAKVYFRSDRDIAVSLPGRRYSLIGGILASAVEHVGVSEEFEDALRVTAREAGRQSAEPQRGLGADASGSFRTEKTAVLDALREHGYEPFQSGDAIRLRNCPFHDLVEEHRDLVCHINESYVTGVLDGLGCQHAQACLEPTEGLCCVAIRNIDSVGTGEEA